MSKWFNAQDCSVEMCCTILMVFIYAYCINKFPCLITVNYWQLYIHVCVCVREQNRQTPTYHSDHRYEVKGIQLFMLLSQNCQTELASIYVHVDSTSEPQPLLWQSPQWQMLNLSPAQWRCKNQCNRPKQSRATMTAEELRAAVTRRSTHESVRGTLCRSQCLWLCYFKKGCVQKQLLCILKMSFIVAASGCCQVTWCCMHFLSDARCRITEDRSPQTYSTHLK